MFLCFLLILTFQTGENAIVFTYLFFCCCCCCTEFNFCSFFPSPINYPKHFSAIHILFCCWRNNKDCFLFFLFIVCYLSTFWRNSKGEREKATVIQQDSTRALAPPGQGPGAAAMEDMCKSKKNDEKTKFLKN